MAFTMGVVVNKWWWGGGSVLGESTSTNTERRLLNLESRVYRLEKNAGLVQSKISGSASISYVALNGGRGEGSEWTKVPGSEFTFDTSLYANPVVSWEGWLDNGLGMVRLYDATNKRAVDGSEVSVTSGTKSSFYSKNLSIWRGQNQYYIEVKSIAGSVVVSQPRLKVLVK